MGYTHGTSVNAEFRTCTCCGETFPNTHKYFNWSNSIHNYVATCKSCQSIQNKERRLKKIEENKNKSLYYDGTRKCKKCGRDLPNNRLYFSIDLSCKDGLRNVCRECNPKEHGFISEGYIPTEKWSERDLQLLKDNYKDYTNRELQIKFFPNRTTRAIECEAQVMGWNGKSEEALQRARMSQANIVRDLMTGRVISEEWRNNISKSRKEYYKTHDGWWKGKKRSLEQCKQMSERMKGHWSGDKNPRHLNPLNGELNGRWKGGINNTYVELRSDTKEWQQESMKFCGYKCVVTGGEFDNVHHTTAFRDIVDESFDITKFDIKPKVQDYDQEEFEILRNVIKELHFEYGYGACIQKDIHKLYHDKYGYTKFSPYSFLEFLYDIDNGKYNKWFDDNNLNININYEYVNYLESTLLRLESA